MPLQIPDDANGAAEQVEDDSNKVQKRTPTNYMNQFRVSSRKDETSRQNTGLVNEPAAVTTRRPNKQMYQMSSSRAAASSQQQMQGTSRNNITTQVPRRNNKDTVAQPVTSDRL
jgi:hypothetical protein